MLLMLVTSLLFFVHYIPVQQIASVMDPHATSFVVNPKNIKRDVNYTGINDKNYII